MAALFHRTSEPDPHVAFLRQCLQEVRNLRGDEITFSDSDLMSLDAVAPGAGKPVDGAGAASVPDDGPAGADIDGSSERSATPQG